MTEPKVVHEFRDYAYNGTMPFERRSMLIGVCDHIDRLAARVQELEGQQMVPTCTTHGEIGLGAACHHCLDDMVAENTRLREALEEIYDDSDYDTAGLRIAGRILGKEE